MDVIIEHHMAKVLGSRLVAALNMPLLVRSRKRRYSATRGPAYSRVALQPR